MSISGGPRRLAGLQRTPAAYANEAALAISSRAGEEGPRRLRTWVRAAPLSSHLGLRRPRSGAALLGCPGAASAGRGAVRTVAANPPRRAGCKLWWRPRGAVSAGAPGSPLYRVPAPSPAPPPVASGRPLPERAAAGRAPARRLCLAPADRAPHRTACAPGRLANCLWSSAAGSRTAQLARSVPAQVSLSPDFLSRLLSTSRGPPAARQAQKLEAGAECAR